MYIFMLVFQLSLNIQYRLSALNRASRGGLQNLRNGWMEIMKVIHGTIEPDSRTLVKH